MPRPYPFSEAVFRTRKAFFEMGLQSPVAITISRAEAGLLMRELKAEKPVLVENWNGGARWEVVFLGLTVQWPAEKVELAGGGFEFT